MEFEEVNNCLTTITVSDYILALKPYYQVINMSSEYEMQLNYLFSNSSDTF